ncbi:3-isopropylmalate dehydrogenase [uncultured Croceitalea sp.]|uniref:3-isopropylmalate dehydrogenase n=1 Tax=uncultured Croceitalea sp. TaxID=1798908 RepID=UPI0033067FD8
MELRIALLPGDGIGPEVLEQAIKCLRAIEETFGHHFTTKEGAIGTIAIDKTGNPLPEETLQICQEADAVLFGAVGHPNFNIDPKAKTRPEQGLLALRKALGLYANIRPVQVFSSLVDNSPLKKEIVSGVDFVIFRELTGGIYFGEKKINEEETVASDLCEYSEFEISRIAHMAFKAAKNRNNKLTLVDKANVLVSSRLWRSVVSKIGESYPEVTLEYLFVDNAAMQLILNPKQFDVILTENMFGDILSDEASVIGGSIGLLASASIGNDNALFEPIHGSYPKAKGENIANPIAAILSAAMMLEHFSLYEEAMAMREAVDKSLKKGIVTPDLYPDTKYGTSHVGDFVADYILEYDDDDFKMNDENIGLGKSTII